MNRLIPSFFLILISLIFLNHIQASDTQKNDKNLLIVSDPYCPYTCASGSEKQGYFVDFAKTALNPLGYKIDYQVMPWKRVLYLAEQGKVDAVLTVEKNDVSSLVVGKVALAKTCQAIVTLASDNSTWTGPESFVGKKMGVINGYFYNTLIDNWLTSNSGDTLTRVSGNNALEILLKMIARKRIDATIADCNVAKITANQMDLDVNLKFHLTGYSSSLYIGIQKNRDDIDLILDAIDSTYLEMEKDGRLKELHQKYDISN